MIQRVKIAPTYSILFLSGSEEYEIPDVRRDGKVLVWSTTSCIVVGCYPEVDGDTEVTLGQANEIDPGYGPSFAGALETPERSIVVSTAGGDEVLGVPVEQTRTRLKIWLSHDKWPEKVSIGIV